MVLILYNTIYIVSINNMKKLYIYLLFFVSILILSIFFYFASQQGKLRKFIKEKSYLGYQKKEVKRLISRNNLFLEELKFYSDFYLENVRPLIKEISFKKIDEQNLKFRNTNLNLEFFKTDILLNGKFGDARATGYLAQHDDKILLFTGDAILSYFSISDLSSEIITSKVIDTNIMNLLPDKEIYSKWTKYQTKDSVKIFSDMRYEPSYMGQGINSILIDDNKIYFSASNKRMINNKECHNASFYSGDLNYEFIKFEELFVPDGCVQSPNKQQGGRIVKFNEKELIFSIGEWRIYEDKIELDNFNPQKDDNLFGKIILFNKENKEYKILAKGLRNPQGLYFDSENNSIVITDHGPRGGDELNIIYNKDKNKIPNFGWPIASYGVPYSPNEKRKFTTHKNFSEPIYYFPDSVGVSQVVKVPNKFIDSQFQSYFVVSMGGDSIEEGDMSIHYFEFDNEKVVKHETYPIYQRIRDILYVEDQNFYLLFFENNSSIGVLRLSE